MKSLYHRSRGRPFKRQPKKRPVQLPALKVSRMGVPAFRAEP